MKAVRARFDGEKVILEEELRGLTPGEVIVIFVTGPNQAPDWLKAQEEALARVWDNEEDAVYDEL
ncbi:MAG: hypothetical protein GY733_16930 [bacterium]|nr:hypothetical protein [bacterium]